MVMVWKTQKVVIQSKKTFLVNITICGLTLGLLTSWLFASIAHSPIGRADWNYYADYCTRYITLTTKMNGEIIKVMEQMFSVCLI